MIPSSKLLLWGAVWTALGGFLAFAGFQQPWLWCTAALVALAGIDAWRLARTPAPRLERTLPTAWSQRRGGTVSLRLTNPGRIVMDLEIFDHHPLGWITTDLPLALRVEPQQVATASVRYLAPERGDALFQPADARIASGLGLWQRQLRLGETESVRVYPDLSRLAGHVLRGTDRHAPAGGVLRKRRRGEGTEFHQLREYRRGDSLRSIDWKATARMSKPITREYQEERDQQVVFLLDGGRRMLARDGTLSHFDHVLEAVLSLGWVAQRQGDAVGLLTFGTTARWIPPRKGRTGIDRLVSGVYDLQPTEAAPDFLEAAQNLLTRLHRRALVIVATNLRDEDDDNLLGALSILRRRHLVLCANLQETALSEALREPVRDFPAALRICGTEEYLGHRRDALARLGLDRQTLVDAIPQNLAALLVDRYLDLKEAGSI